MTERAFDRDTLIDLTVNVIPLGILAFFIALYTIYQPFGWEFGPIGLMYGLTIVPFVILTVVTYVSGHVVYRDEQEATKTTTEHDVGEQPRTHRQTGDTSETDDEGATGVNRETTSAKATGDVEQTADENDDDEEPTNDG